MDKFIDNHKSHNQDKRNKSDLIEDNVNDEMTIKNIIMIN